MKLNGWQRIGIVVSVVWSLSAGIYTRHVIKSQEQTYAWSTYKACETDEDAAAIQWREHCRALAHVGDWRTAYVKCMTTLDPVKSSTACITKGFSDAHFVYRNWWIKVLAVAIMPWGIYLILFVVRWVMRGFVRPSS